MKAKESDWYKKIWSLDCKEQSWTEDTQNQVDFIIQSLDLKGNEKILDLACGFGRHSLELARRGYIVTGVDITKVFIDDAIQSAKKEHLSITFINEDIRNLSFHEEFDVVLNLADGAIGYLENEEENNKIFDCISNALKPGGKSFIEIQSGDYANAHFPLKTWDAGEKGLTLSYFEWDKDTHILLYGQKDYTYGAVLTKPYMPYGDPIRLYTQKEIEQIMKSRNMKLDKTYCDYKGNMASEKEFQLIAISRKG